MKPERERWQWLNKMLWDILLELIIKTYCAFLHSTTVSHHFTSSMGSETLSKTMYNRNQFYHRLTYKQDLSPYSISSTLKGNSAEQNVIQGSAIYTAERKICYSFHEVFLNPTRCVFNTYILWNLAIPVFFFPLLNIQKLYNKLLEGETTAKTNKQ